MQLFDEPNIRKAENKTKHFKYLSVISVSTRSNIKRATIIYQENALAFRTVCHVWTTLTNTVTEKNFKEMEHYASASHIYYSNVEGSLAQRFSEPE